MSAILTDEKLREEYREVSTDLRSNGYDALSEDRINRMMLLEEEMRHRGLNPDEIARDVEKSVKVKSDLPEIETEDVEREGGA